jgi:hypothetical protein
MRERLLRIRYAVVSAVLTAGYLPLRESVLTRLDHESAEAPTEPNSREPLGSFETFKAGGGKFVTLVWTEKVKSIDNGIIESIKKRVVERRAVVEGNWDDREPEIHILHHGSSEDLVHHTAASKEGLFPEICFMRATISGSKHDEFRGIISDDKLGDALVSELSLRIPALTATADKGDKPPPILVITESDTRYSRAVFRQLQEKFKGKAVLFPYSYLRGLDGRSENVTTTPESTKLESNDTVALILQGWGIAEKSSGTSQFDYLRRLALRFGSGTKEWKAADVAAVGVLGSDIYDKMLVLQAVRRALPSAIFFTTDLDALYLEQESQQFTRNLVVASAESLDVSNVPPMRDSYQTVLAKKVLNLLGQSIPAPTPARVFEIALGKSIALDAPSSAGEFVLRLLSKGYVKALIFGLALINAFLVLAAVFTRKARPDEDHPKITIAPMKPLARAFVYAEVGGAFIGMIVLLYFFGSEETMLLGEPLALGVSIWPSVMIRLLAFLVAILLLRLASRSLVLKSKELRNNLHIEPTPYIQSSLAQCLAKQGVRLWRSLKQKFARLIGNLIFEKASPSPEQPFDIYLARFFGSDDPPVWWRNSRLWRLIGFSAIYFAISACLFAIWPPSVPGRGVSLLIEKVVLALGVALFIVHLIFCLDFHIGAFKFIRALRSSSYAPARGQENAKIAGMDAKSILGATSALTEIIGKTLLYPLTVLILIILSRLPNFDNWVMAPSLTLTFSAGALVLMTASLVLWLAGSNLKKEVLEKHDAAYEKKEAELAKQISEESSRPKDASAKGSVTPGVATETKAATLAKELKEVKKAFKKDKADLDAINDGVFAAWYNQPIFAAIFSAAAVFGSLSIAGPLARFFFS